MLCPHEWLVYFQELASGQLDTSSSGTLTGLNHQGSLLLLLAGILRLASSRGRLDGTSRLIHISVIELDWLHDLVPSNQMKPSV
jgi:hypothetical protein